jgi:hypothetical protein
MVRAERNIGEKKMNDIFLSAIFLSLPHYLSVPHLSVREFGLRQLKTMTFDDALGS